MFRSISLRAYSTLPPTSREAWLYVDSIFPIQLGRWDLRHYIGILRQDNLLSSLQSRLEKINIYDFKPLEYQPQQKDGGVFVRFSYTPPESEQANEWSALQSTLNEQVAKDGALPTWWGLGTGGVWVVRGSPWKEDMDRFASPILKFKFEGPDIQDQSLYELCRPYGRIQDLVPPLPVPAGSSRFATVTFHQIHSATITRNVIHGLRVPADSSSTRLRAQYEQPIQAHAIRNWMSGHPKIMLPIIIFLLGTLTYTIFDPIRSLMVEAKMLNWFDYQQFKIYQWVRMNTVNLLSGTSHSATHKPQGEVWKERKDAEAALNAYLSDMPTTIAFLHGPQGSGKTSMLQAIVQNSGRNTLIIDCRQLNNAPSDAALVSSLAAQTGYWPVFNFVNSMGNLIDLASVGLMGQKAGLSSSLPEQMKQILDVVTTGLKGVSSSHRASIQKQVQQQEAEERQEIQNENQRRAIMAGTWHDGRLDAVSGNGVMSELGVGDELFGDDMADSTAPITVANETKESEKREQVLRRQKALEDVEAINALPIVIIRNYAMTSVSTGREEVLNVLAQWAATLAENHLAHVIVLSDNRENSKRLAKTLPTKPLNSIALSDADPKSSLSFVKQKLHDAGVEIGISSQDTQYVERLGGRASDLESLIHKVRSGMKVDEAVNDIINRGVAELRKNAFGEDTDDAKSLPWTRYQAWKVLKLLAKSPEVGYYDILVDFPFKGDENALRGMEHAELITILTKDGRPSTIRPGKPVFRWVFERVVNDKTFQATQELAYNEKQIADTEAKIQTYEQELALLVETMEKERRPWWSLKRSPCVERARNVGDKLVIAGRKVETLERKNAELKKVLGHVI